ncbi:MAG: methyltransferase domain-containing protein [Deltaproteobacteria bacterium]|nr:methyltransferase domain-containing protein [Deltaproteobacteria bacterium]
MADLDHTRAYYNDFSRWYERERGRGYHGMIDDLELSVAEPFARGGRVLEVGCGTGLILERLARVASHATGLDLSPGMLEKARERGLDVHEGLATALPFPDDTFDLVCSFKVLAHVPDIRGALGEMVRVCRPGGVVLAEFYNPWSLRYLAKRLGPAGRVSDRRTEAEVYTRFDSPSDVRSMVPKNAKLLGFRGVRVLTPAAVLHRLPGLSRALQVAERALVDSALSRFGGFLVAVLEKHPVAG